MNQRKRTQPNIMATASLSMGICAIISLFNVERAVFFGSLGILFACLSRGDSLKMPEKSVGGFATSIFAIVISVLLTLFSILLMVEMFGMETVMNPEALQKAITDLYTQLLEEMPAGGSIL